MSIAPQPNWAGSPGPSNNNWVPAMLVGAAIFAVGCGGGLVTGWMAGMANNVGNMMQGMMGPVELDLDAQYPATVQVGQPFEIVLRVTDTRGVGRTITDIDFDGAICDDFTFGTLTPAPTNTDASFPGYIEHVYNTTIPASGTAEFRFTLTPNTPGVFNSSTITVYDQNYSSAEVYLQITAQ